MIFAKAKTRSLRMMRTARAGQGSPGSFALWVAPKHEATTKAATGLQARRMDKPHAAAGICIPGRRRLRISLVGSKRASNEFSSGEEESFGSESRVDSRRVLSCWQAHPRGFRYDGGMELSAWLLRI